MRSGRRATLAVAFFAALLTACVGVGVTATTQTQTWLVVSDIHLDPYNDSPDPSWPGKDTNLSLFRSALAEMKKEVPDPSVVLLPGDFLMHNFPAVVRRRDPNTAPTTAALRIMNLLATTFGKSYPHARFAIALGNNDAPCGDYRSDEGDAYLAAVGRAWAPLIDRGTTAPDFERSFARGGYYTVTLPVRGLRLVVLNTVLFSGEYRGSCTSSPAGGPKAELRWMDATLRATPSGVRNVVMMHVPPGYDPVSTEMTRGFVPWSFLKGNDNAALIAALEAANDRVAYAVAGHLHRFDFRVLGTVPLIVFGSISPVYRGSPSFYGVHVAADGSLRDIDVYAYDEWGSQWNARRSFDRTWGVDRIDVGSLQAIHDRLGSDAAARRTWDIASNGWPSNPALMWPIWNARWRVPWCAQTVTESGFSQCAGIERRVVAGRILLVGAAGAALALCAIVIWLLRRAMRHASVR